MNSGILVRLNMPIKACVFCALLCLPALAAAEKSAPQASLLSGGNDYFSYQLDGKLRLRHEEFDGIYSQNGGAREDSYLRRADLGISGVIAGKLDYEWAGKINSEHEWSVKTFYLGFAPTQNTYLKLGRHDADFGLEMSSSSNWSLAVERASLWDLSPDAGEAEEGYGASASMHSALARLSIGHFAKDDIAQYTLRAVLKPLHKKRHLLHLGYSYADAYDAASDGRIRTNLGLYAVERHPDGNRTTLARKVDDTLFTEDKTAVLEFAYVLGPFSLQAEHLKRSLQDEAAVISRRAEGHYVQLAYSLTGEARNYDEDNAVFGRLKAKQKRWGAWELFARREALKIAGEAGMLSKKRARSQAEITLGGVNWYPGDNWRATLQASHGESVDVPNENDDTQGSGVSLQVLYRFGG